MYTKAAQFKFEKLRAATMVAAILCQWVLQIEELVKIRLATTENSEKQSEEQTADFVPNIQVLPPEPIKSPQSMNSDPLQFNQPKSNEQVKSP